MPHDLPASLVAAACELLEEDERLARAGSRPEVRAELLALLHVVVRDFSADVVTAAQAERRLRRVLRTTRRRRAIAHVPN